MPDAKDSALTLNTTPLLTDQVRIVDDPATNPASQRMAFDSLLGSGWLNPGETWVYVSPTSFKIVGVDVTARYQTGRKLRCKQGGGYKYFYVVSSAFATDTTVTITGGSDYSLANATITDNYFSYVDTPEGFPDWFAYTPTVTAGSGTFTSVSATGAFKMVGRQVFLRGRVAITTNGTAAIDIRVTLPITADVTDLFMGGARETTTTGKLCWLQLLSAVALGMANYDNTYPGANGYQFPFAGSYRV